MMIKLRSHLAGGDIPDDWDFLLSNYFNIKRPAVASPERGFRPQMDLYETVDELVIVMEIAGVKEKNISVTLYSGFIVIQGSRKTLNRGEHKSYHKMEIDYGRFERVVKLPCPVREDNIVANYKDGFLEVRLMKGSNQEIGTDIPISDE